MRIYPLIFKTNSTPSAFLNAGVPTSNLLFTGTKAHYQSSVGDMALIPIGGKESDVSEMLYNDEYLPASSTVPLHLADF